MSGVLFFCSFINQGEGGEWNPSETSLYFLNYVHISYQTDYFFAAGLGNNVSQSPSELGLLIGAV